VWTQPAQQLPIAAAGRRQLVIAEQATLLVDDGGVVGAAVGVDAADDNAGALGHPGVAVPLEDRHAPAGRADTPVTGLECTSSYKLVSGHTSPSGRVHHVVLPDRPTNPGNDTQSGPVRVRPAGKTSPMIRDPHIFTGPVTWTDWLSPRRSTP